MDGNGRWAKKRGMPRSAGHTVGAANFKTITRYCAKIGIEYLTVYAFSTENWKRPSAEINGLMKLFKQYLEESLRDFRDDDIKVRFIGDTEAFSSDLRQLIEETREVCKDRTGMVLNIAMNYGGRDELRRAVTKSQGKRQMVHFLPMPLRRIPFLTHWIRQAHPTPTDDSHQR